MLHCGPVAKTDSFSNSNYVAMQDQKIPYHLLTTNKMNSNKMNFLIIQLAEINVGTGLNLLSILALGAKTLNILSTQTDDNQMVLQNWSLERRHDQ